MNVTSISDGTIRALQVAIDGLAARQQSIAANVANVETPGYRARIVDFEDSLRAALAGGDPADTKMSVTESLAPTRSNGNNVNMDFELLAEKENVLHQRLLVQALTAKYSLVRTAITGQ